MKIWKPQFERRKCFGPSHLQGVADRWHHRKQSYWSQLVSGLHVPRYLQMQSLGFPCCCEETVDCYCCLNAPTQFALTFDGIEEGNCGSCDTFFNNTFILTYYGNPFGDIICPGCCVWLYEISPAVCGMNFISITVDCNATGGYWLQINLAYYDAIPISTTWGHYCTWEIELDPVPDPCTFLDYDVPFTSDFLWGFTFPDNYCTATSSTCTVNPA